MALISWRERYSCHSLQLRNISLGVSWSTDRKAPGYVVRVGDRTLKELAPDAEEGKRRAMSFAIKLLKSDMIDLEELSKLPV